MDYDRYDAFLHHIFKQTQGDAWFRPNEDALSAGVALRIIDNPPQFRVFPYENIALEPFETAVAALNPVVAVKVRSAAVHAALADVGPDDKNIYIDANTRIQILDTILLLPHADKEQGAAFIRDERVLIVWSDTLDAIIPTCNDFDNRLIKLLWRSRPNHLPPSTPVTATASTTRNPIPNQSGFSSLAGSVSGHSLVRANGRFPTPADVEKALDLSAPSGDGNTSPSLEDGHIPKEKLSVPKPVVKRNWFGKIIDVEKADEVLGKRPTQLYAPIYNGFAAGLAVFFIGNGVKTVLQEWSLDGSFVRFALFATLPMLYCVGLFFALQIIQNITMAIGPIAHCHENSKYYSAIPPRPNKVVDNRLPHVTIQMPIYKESLQSVLIPSIESIKRAMQTYARQGGTSTIFVNDDGLRLLPTADSDARIAFYKTHGIGWVARPPHDPAPGGFKRAGRFKKASNMNYALTLSLKAERHLAALQRGRLSTSTSGGCRTSLGREGAEETDPEGDLEERALAMAIEETSAATGGQFRPWAANGKAVRIGEILLLVDSDTIVPEDCMRDAAREMAECPTVAIIQHASDIMQIAHHYFENGFAYFTRRINRCISMACANGEVAPFVGHNAFLRWQALQDAAFVDADGQEKIWSESNVSEDFDVALRLQRRGYIIRWATYAKGMFKEGVSLTVDDEINRWQKYAYGCNELLFNPFVQWWRKGPIARPIHEFLWSNAPLHYKISMMAYMFSYYGIAAAILISVVNYVMLGFEFPVDGFYIHSFEIWLATTVVFFGSGNLGYTLLEYRLGEKEFFRGLLENLMWIPFFFFFFGGLGIPLGQAILAHLFSYNISWSATKKEVEQSNFFKEVPKILKRFWFPFVVSVVIIAGMVVCSTSLVPLEWRVDGSGWAVIFPLSVLLGCHILFPIVLNPWLMIFSY